MTAANLNLGAGTLYWAPLASTEPMNLTTAWAVAWKKIGYTQEGHTMTYDLTTEDIYVAEEIEPVLVENTKLAVMVGFAMAEMTVQSLTLALNGGTVTTTATETTFDPPNPALAPTAVMLGWESRSADERIVWRNCVQTKAVEIKRAKAPTYVTLPVAFKVLKPSSGRSYKHIVSLARN
jgi:hypothetical protein